LAQLRRDLLQTLSLFRSAWGNSTCVGGCFWCEQLAFVELNRRALGLPVFISTDDFQFSTTTANLVVESLLRARDRVLVLVKQLFDPQRHFHVAFAIDALAGAVLLRRQHRKFRFPVAQDVRLHTRELTNFPDLEKQLIGKGYSRATH